MDKEIVDWCLRNIPQYDCELSKDEKIHIMLNSYVFDLKRGLLNTNPYVYNRIQLDTSERILVEFCKEFGRDYPNCCMSLRARLLEVKHRLSFYNISCKLYVDKVDNYNKRVQVKVCCGNTLTLVLEISKLSNDFDLFISDVKGCSRDTEHIVTQCFKELCYDSMVTVYALSCNFDISIGAIYKRLMYKVASPMPDISTALISEEDMLILYSEFNSKHDFKLVFSRYFSIFTSILLGSCNRKWISTLYNFNSPLKGEVLDVDMIAENYSNECIVNRTTEDTRYYHRLEEGSLEVLTIYPIFNGIDTGLIKLKFSPFAKDFEHTVVRDRLHYIDKERSKSELIIFREFMERKEKY